MLVNVHKRRLSYVRFDFISLLFSNTASSRAACHMCPWRYTQPLERRMTPCSTCSRASTLDLWTKQWKRRTLEQDMDSISPVDVGSSVYTAQRTVERWQRRRCEGAVGGKMSDRPTVQVPPRVSIKSDVCPHLYGWRTAENRPIAENQFNTCPFICISAPPFLRVAVGWYTSICM